MIPIMHVVLALALVGSGGGGGGGRVAGAVRVFSSGGNGGVQVMDGNRKVLGTLEGLSSPASYSQQSSSFVVFRNGYFITMRFDGKFPVAFQGYDLLMWDGPGCTGNVYLAADAGTTIGTHLVVYSGQQNRFFVPAGSGPLAGAVVPLAIQSVESGFVDLDNTSACYSVENWLYPGWPLAGFDVGEGLGWTVGGNPARVTGPVSFQ